MRTLSAALALVAIAATASCTHDGDGAAEEATAKSTVKSDSDGTTRQAKPLVPATSAAVVFEPPGADPARVTVEVVSKRHDVRRGLMYRQHMPSDHGMLFLMKQEEDHTFWMKNTLISLDIIFVTRDLVVAGVLENMKPLDRHSRGVGKPSLYVVEVNGGWTKAHGVAAGTKVRFENVLDQGSGS